ncbi:reverse transcriptase [Gossypium australe]|uniref:Reverse transcriptase n=1 Tax=Gossypium australe TaxID=47621 RepID=A0A5B6VH04_9ROSI|nr:reverse transcriptase [Gossypium australe]
MTVKLDMSKAYDRVEWDFLKEVMNKMGFASKWIELIMRCVTSVSYAVSINGNRGRTFKPSRGLRECNPLSPFLFLICSEGLSALMRIAKKKGLVRGAKASRKSPEISHLLFADDCLMFGEATEKGARVLKDILKHKYERGIKRSSLETIGIRRSTWACLIWWVDGKRRLFRIWLTESLRELRVGVPDYCPNGGKKSSSNQYFRRDLVKGAYIGVNGGFYADPKKRGD